MRADESPRWFPLALLASLVAGAALRLYELPAQILADDEWHAVHAVAAHGPGWIYTHFGASDHSIPLALLYELLAGTVGLSEIVLRAPMLLGGLALVVVAPLLARPLVGAKSAGVLAWLLAISPLLTYYSRYARPYGLAVTLAVVAAFAFLRWWRGGARPWAAAHVACAALAAWMLPVWLPFLLAPVSFGVVALVARRSERSLRELALVGGALALLLAALLGPPLVVDAGALTSKGVAELRQLPSYVRVFELATGAQVPLLGFAMGLACLAGVFALKRRDPALVLYLGFLAGAQLLALAVVRPNELGAAIVTVRYSLPLVVLLLLVAAVGLARLDELAKAELRFVPRPLVSAGVGLSLLLFGPLVSLHDARWRIYTRPNSFTNHALFQIRYSPADRTLYAQHTIQPEAVSRFYATLRNAERPGAALVEVPCEPAWDAQAGPVYQRIHRLPVLAGMLATPEKPPGFGELPWPDPRFRLRNHVPLSQPDELRARGVRYVVFHKDLKRELPSAKVFPRPEVWGWAQRYRELVGEPVFQDQYLLVFDLAPDG